MLTSAWHVIPRVQRTLADGAIIKHGEAGRHRVQSAGVVQLRMGHAQGVQGAQHQR